MKARERGPTTGGGAVAAAHTSLARPAKLPPNPSTTLCLPQQQRAKQRAAEKAMVEQDAAVLQRLLGGGPPAPPTDAQPQPQSQAQAQAVGSPRAAQPTAPPPAALDGCLSSATLQSLLSAPQPGHMQQQQQPALQPSCSWAGGGSSPPGGPLLAAEPSALTAYITRLEEHSNLMERQLTHLQASTSGGGGGGTLARAPFPSPLRSARHPLAPGRREVFVLSKWLEVRGGAGLASPRAVAMRGCEEESPDLLHSAMRAGPTAALDAPPLLPCPPQQAETQRFNATYARKDERTPLVDFLLLAAAQARQLYGQAYAELARQVGGRRLGCWRRGALAGCGCCTCHSARLSGFGCSCTESVHTHVQLSRGPPRVPRR